MYIIAFGLGLGSSIKPGTGLALNSLLAGVPVSLVQGASFVGGSDALSVVGGFQFAHQQD